mgnify:CR=1 FL=1
MGTSDSGTADTGTAREPLCDGVAHLRFAAAYVGGRSAAGGVGSIFASLIGALVMISLTSGMTLMGVDANLQYVVRGLVLVAAVIFDVTTRRSGR